MTYLNLPDVKKAIHVDESIHWCTCASSLSVPCTRNFSVNYTPVRDDMTPYVKKILDANVRILVYYGDSDLGCNYIMGKEFTKSLGLKVRLEGNERHRWARGQDNSKK